MIVIFNDYSLNIYLEMTIFLLISEVEEKVDIDNIGINKRYTQ